MRKAYQFRLNPSHHQRTVLLKTLDACRWVYNETLAIRKNTWEQEKKSLSLYETNKLLTGWKVEKPELIEVHSQVLQNVQARVDLAFQAFYRRVKAGQTPGYPRFRGRGRYDSITFKQSGFRICENKLVLSKIGAVKIVLHRPMEGQIKTLTVRRDRVGNWYACFACEVPEHPLSKCESVVGVDVGLESFITLSNGEKVANPRFFRKDEQALAKAQRRLSKAETGTAERGKRRKAVAHLHQRIANRRKDFSHQLSRQLVNNYGVIVFEKLNEQGMLQNHRLAKSIGDAAWSQLIQYSMYKAEDAGRVVRLVDPKGTSQRCSCCGVVVDKALSVRVHDCPGCGLKIDRDENAALNILALGLESLGTIRRSHAALAAVE